MKNKLAPLIILFLVSCGDRDYVPPSFTPEAVVDWVGYCRDLEAPIKNQQLRTYKVEGWYQYGIDERGNIDEMPYFLPLIITADWLDMGITPDELPSVKLNPIPSAYFKLNAWTGSAVLRYGDTKYGEVEATCDMQVNERRGEFPPEFFEEAEKCMNSECKVRKVIEERVESGELQLPEGWTTEDWMDFINSTDD